MHLELQAKPGCFCFGKPLIRWSEGLELEAGERLATARSACPKVDDWLEHRNEAGTVERGLDPSQPGTKELQIVLFGGRATFLSRGLVLVRMESPRKGDVERSSAMVSVAGLQYHWAVAAATCGQLLHLS